jgi:hypothetical protein
MKVSVAEAKDVVIPEEMQCSMAGQTERERRAKIIATEEQVTKEELRPDGG